jgi:hypothetical protein
MRKPVASEDASAWRESPSQIDVIPTSSLRFWIKEDGTSWHLFKPKAVVIAASEPQSSALWIPAQGPLLSGINFDAALKVLPHLVFTVET